MIEITAAIGFVCLCMSILFTGTKTFKSRYILLSGAHEQANSRAKKIVAVLVIISPLLAIFLGYLSGTIHNTVAKEIALSVLLLLIYGMFISIGIDFRIQQITGQSSKIIHKDMKKGEKGSV